jgi:hypothetical protein
MTTTKGRPELVRMAWCTELRRHPERQCHGVSCKGEQVCALMLLADMTGDVPRYTKRPMRNAIDYPTIAARAGLSPEQSQKVIHLNDYGREPWPKRRGAHNRPQPLMFPEIAAEVECWFADSK